jgi:hypothetical protein
VVKKVCVQRVYKFSKTEKKFRCVSYKSGEKKTICVKYDIKSGKRVCVKRGTMFKVQYCKKWNKKSICKKHFKISTSRECVSKSNIDGKTVCLKYRIRVPRFFCEHYRMVKGKRVCATSSVYYGKNTQFICLKRANQVKIVSAETLIKRQEVKLGNSESQVIGKVEKKSCGCMDYKIKSKVEKVVDLVLPSQGRKLEKKEKKIDVEVRGEIKGEGKHEVHEH